jgi:hypothetical protein
MPHDFWDAMVGSKSEQYDSPAMVSSIAITVMHQLVHSEFKQNTMYLITAVKAGTKLVAKRASQL